MDGWVNTSKDKNNRTLLPHCLSLDNTNANLRSSQTLTSNVLSSEEGVKSSPLTLKVAKQSY